MSSKSEWKFNINKHIKYHFKKPCLNSLCWNITSNSCCRLYLLLSKFVGVCLNNTEIYNKKTFHNAVSERNGRGLITVANHTSRLDDPLVWNLIGWRNFKLSTWRWSTAAEDVCFKSKAESCMMAIGKVLPVTRGEGVFQRSMDFCVNEIIEGRWVHIFPEGKINLDQKPMRLKWGVGRLIAEPNITPMVLLIHHTGFETVFPNDGRPLFPRLGKKTSIYISDMLDLTTDVQKMKDLMKTPEEMRQRLTDIIEEEMATLKLKAEQFHEQCFGQMHSSISQAISPTNQNQMDFSKCEAGDKAGGQMDSSISGNDDNASYPEERNILNIENDENSANDNGVKKEFEKKQSQ
ncbi:tafazzin-like [Mya arenaria]|uniref:tafazzin-like n=1 Tax=Mya arenaria TaxID=6604 RepID=UPI0022E2D4A5|nr:tafazzin-like [Mya arenaria]